MKAWLAQIRTITRKPWLIISNGLTSRKKQSIFCALPPGEPKNSISTKKPLNSIVGATRAAGLGHMLMFGLGGVHVEVLGDVVFRLCPVSAPQAQGMLAAIRAAALLDGVRGRPALCKRALVELIQRLSMMLAELPEIEELDLNPVLAFADSVCAVDGRIRVGVVATA